MEKIVNHNNYKYPISLIDLSHHIPQEQSISDYIPPPHPFWFLNKSVKPFQSVFLPP